MSLHHPIAPWPAALVLLLAGCAKISTPAVAPAVKIETDRVTFAPNSPQRATLAVAAAAAPPRAIHHVTGRLVWDEDATVRIYSPVEGRVQLIGVDVGARVEPGAMLARIDSPDFGQAQADLRKAGADLQLAERTLARTRTLFEHGAVARKDLDAAENAQVGAEAEQRRAAARLARYGAAQDADGVNGVFLLRVPVAGVVVEKNINVGQEVRPDLMLANDPKLLAPQFVVSDPRRLWVLLDVTEMDVGVLRAGQPLHVRSRALPEQVFAGYLATIGYSLDAATRTVKARGTVANPDFLLKAEMYVDIGIDLPVKNAATVEIASSAVFTKEARHYVFVETAPGSFMRREVEAGAESAGKILVEHGLQPGERVLVENSLLVEALLEAGSKP